MWGTWVTEGEASVSCSCHSHVISVKHLGHGRGKEPTQSISVLLGRANTMPGAQHGADVHPTPPHPTLPGLAAYLVMRKEKAQPP